MKTTELCDECGKLDFNADSENDGNHVCDECIDKYIKENEAELEIAWRKQFH